MLHKNTTITKHIQFTTLRAELLSAPKKLKFFLLCPPPPPPNPKNWSTPLRPGYGRGERSARVPARSIHYYTIIRLDCTVNELCTAYRGIVDLRFTTNVIMANFQLNYVLISVTSASHMQLQKIQIHSTKMYAYHILVIRHILRR